MDEKSFYLFTSISCLFLSWWIRSLSGDVCFVQWEVLSMFKNFHQTKWTETPVWCKVIVWLIPITRVSSIRGNEFCHWKAKFCMFCLFYLHNESISQSDQTFMIHLVSKTESRVSKVITQTKLACMHYYTWWFRLWPEWLQFVNLLYKSP